MSSEPKGAFVDTVSEGRAGPIEHQGSANMPGLSMGSIVGQAPEPDANFVTYGVLQEKVPAQQDPMHSPPQGEAKSDQKTPSNLAGNFIDLKNDELPKWVEGDPYEYLFKATLEKDTDQCASWKDEVQNTLIFAGLFSAVVTAFIIESYQRLQPDSNDVMVGLLAHIASRLDNAPNNTQSVSSVITNADFSPSRADITINVFWFISLVLSLTTALIGIVTLQWLREHQRYDMTHKPQERLAILNARLHSLTQWYVPQIFAALPLLLQGALILFFAGMIEFLFARRLEVAIPVTLSICVPLIFLVSTTVFPLLQVCILQDAFRLSINNDVPSPCPYKSPQSLITRRIGVGSHIIFRCISSVVSGAYICVVKIMCFKRKFDGNRPPIFHSQRPILQSRLRDGFPSYIGFIVGPQADPPDNWTSTDAPWMEVRSTYALSLQMVHRADTDLIAPREGSYYVDEHAELYDCTSFFQEFLRLNQPNVDFFNALYASITTICSQAVDSFEKFNLADTVPNAAFTDMSFAFSRFVCRELDRPSPICVSFIKDIIHHESSDDEHTVLDTLSTVFTLSWMCDTDMWELREHTGPTTDKLMSWLVAKRLGLGPMRLFSMETEETWLPRPVLGRVLFSRSDFAEDIPSSVVTTCFHTFLKDCSEMRLKSPLEIRSASARESYGAISAYMQANVRIASKSETINNLAHLTQLCGSTPPQDLIQHKPFLLIAACIYLDNITIFVNAENYLPLSGIITKACGTEEVGEEQNGWTGPNDAIEAIYKHHNPSQQRTGAPDISAHLSIPIDYDDKAV